MVTNRTCSTRVGVFQTREAADKAIADLRAAGYRDDQIGLVAKDTRGNTVRTDGAGTNKAGEGAAIGAAAGAATGAAVGAGILAGIIPVIGPVLAIGTLGTILVNAAGGAAIAGLAGALIGWGIPEEDAKYYEGEVNAGRYVVTADCRDRTDDADQVLSRHGGYSRQTSAMPASAVSRASEQRTVQVHEEQLRVQKTPVQAGEVRVHKEVHTEHQNIQVPVKREEVVIERRPAHGPASTSDIRAGEEVRIPVREEQVRVTKENVVKEEVVVGKRKVTDTQQVKGEVRKEDVKIEKQGDVIIRDKSSTGKKR